MGARALFHRHPHGDDRGTLAAFAYPDQRDQDSIKRVVALAGDVIEVDAEGTRIINLPVSYGFATPRIGLPELTT